MAKKNNHGTGRIEKCFENQRKTYCAQRRPTGKDVQTKDAGFGRKVRMF